MTTPAVFRERWANRTAPVTVPAGAPAAAPGATQAWQLAGPFGGWGTWTAASGVIMRLYDPALPLEIVRATALTAGGVATVVRGDQGTEVTPHRPGFELASCVTAGGLGARAPGPPSGQGLVLPTTTQVRSWSGNELVDVAAMIIPGGEAARPGSCYEAVAFGYAFINGGHFEVQQLWGGIAVGGHYEWTVAAAANTRWRIHAQITTHNVGQSVLSGTVEVLLSDNQAQNVGVRRYQLAPAETTGPAGINLANPALYHVTVRLPDATTGRSCTVQGGRAWRSA